MAVAFASSRAEDTLAQPAATDEAGLATGAVTSGTVGTAVLSGTMDGVALPLTHDVGFEAAFAPTPPAEALAVPGRTCAAASFGNTGRRVSLDALGVVYLASVCGGEGFVAVSADGGKTFGAPVTTGMTGLAMISVRGGPAGVAYVAGTTTAGATLFTVTADRGATFAAPAQLATGADMDRAASIAVRGDAVYVQPSRSTLSVFRNASRGVGAFEVTALGTNVSAVFSGLMVDSAGTIWSGLDNSPLYLSSSTDGGTTFSPWAGVAGAAVSYSSWDLGADTIWVAGSLTTAYRISVATPTVGTAVGGLVSSVTLQETVVAVDAAGTAYVARADATSGVRLQRALLMDAAFGAAAVVDAAGRYPALAATKEPGTVIVAYQRGAAIWLTVREY